MRREKHSRASPLDSCRLSSHLFVGRATLLAPRDRYTSGHGIRGLRGPAAPLIDGVQHRLIQAMCHRSVWSVVLACSFVSIIIPAYNEELRLQSCLDQVLSFTARQPEPMDVIVVENGSTDRTTEVADAYATRHASLCVLHSKPGKGAAVRCGMLAGTGQYLFACDADLSMPIEGLRAFLPPTLCDYDVAIGSREAKGARRYNEPVRRHLMGRVFNAIVRTVAINGLQDTQCGFKSFRHDVAKDVFSRLTMDGWAFDVEALVIARELGYQITEVPIQWTFDSDSRVDPLRDTWRMFRDTLRVRRLARAGHYRRNAD